MDDKLDIYQIRAAFGLRSPSDPNQRPRLMDNDPRPMPLEPTKGCYTGPLCTEREPCDRCAAIRIVTKAMGEDEAPKAGEK